MKNFKLIRQRIFIGFLLFFLLLIGASSYILWQNRAERVRSAGGGFSVMALALVELMDSHLRYATSSLEEIDRDLLAAGGVDKVSPQDMHNLLRRLSDLDNVVAHNLPFGAYFVVDKNGTSRGNSLSYPSSALNASDREYFKYHTKMPGRELYVSTPIQSRLTGERVIVFTRRISDATGEFVGVIGVQLSLNYLNNFYRSVGLGERATIFLGRLDGQGIFRYPNSDKFDSTNLSTNSTFQEMLNLRSGWVSTISPYEKDGENDKIVGFHTSENFPLVAIVGNTRDNVNSSWISAVMPQFFGLLSIGAGLVAVFLFTLRQLKRFEKNSLQEKFDPLTGLHSRGELDGFLEQEWNRARRSHTPVSLLYIDIDYFRRFNEAFGHIEGDRCLKRIAEIIRAEFRRVSDMTARIGGEELACLLSNTTTEEAMRLGECVLEKVRAAAIMHPDSLAEKVVTVSIGVATIVPTLEASWHALFEQAEKALVHAKSNGRNRLVAWTPELEADSRALGGVRS